MVSYVSLSFFVLQDLQVAFVLCLLSYEAFVLLFSYMFFCFAGGVPLLFTNLQRLFWFLWRPHMA